MKRFVTLLSVVVTELISCCPMSHCAPRGVWLDTTHDFGAFDEALGVVRCTFDVVNAGDEPLVVLAARANCGCTVPQFSDRPVAPGDTARITVGFDPTGRPGRFSKNVVVTTNATPAKTTLVIKGAVIGTSNTLRGRYPVDAGAMRLRSSSLSYGDVPRTATGGQYVEGYNASPDTLRPVVVSHPRHISAIVSPAAVPPGENFVISTVFDPVASQQWDIVTDSLTVEAAGREVVLHTVAVVKEDFSGMTPAQLDRAPVISVGSEKLDAGRIDTGGKPLHLVVEISNKGREPLRFRRVYSTDKCLSLRVPDKAVKPGKSVKIPVAVDVAGLAGREMLNSRIIIITNDPANPRTVVRVVGELTR